MSNSTRTAVVVMAYGTPRTKEEILPYYTDIRRGRPPTEEALQDLINRYEAIGGLSPLKKLTEDQATALQRELDEIQPGQFTVFLGLKHATPFVEDAVADVVAQGFKKIVGIVLAPHFSSYSIGQYMGRVREAAEPHGIEVSGVESWARNDEFIDFLARDLNKKLATLPEHTKILFTAHSLPQRIIDGGDPYPDELRATAELVAQRAGLTDASKWSIAWQSAGRTPEPWIGPDILDVIDSISTARNSNEPIKGVLVSACGFVADHLEVLYDLDIEAALRAHQHGLAFARTACVNDDATVMASLARMVAAA
ncbi:MAG: ferrochelatase [Ilumatobacteraceae bacterium]